MHLVAKRSLASVVRPTAGTFRSSTGFCNACWLAAGVLLAILLLAILHRGAAAEDRSPVANPAEATSPAPLRPPVVATFSIVAYDPETQAWGVAVQSRVLAVGSIVPFAQAGVGAIATQSYANTTYGPRGLAMLAEGKSAAEVVAALTADDPDRNRRQVAIVDREGRVAHFTGEGCLEWAGAEDGEFFSCQGNILAGPEVVADMAKAFRETSGRLAERLMAALEAGQAAGGDVRGQQSAAILVVRRGAGYAGFDDREIDLRVDDHETPIVELRRILTKKLARLR